MGLEIISKVLSSTNATYVNGVSAERRFAPAVLKNMYQSLVEADGRGITDKFVSEDDAQSSAQVFVNRVLPVEMLPREQGANKNGASFSANQHYTQTETVGIDILTLIDDTIIIPRARQDMIKTDLLAEQVEIYSNRLATILNGATAGCKIFETWKAKAEGKAVNEKVISSTDISNKEVLNRFIEANSLLDEGDDAHGVDVFPTDTRVAVFKVGYRATLKVSGVLVLGGANAVYEIAKGDAISTGAKARRENDGYIGEIDGVPCHIISNESIKHASQFMGFPANELKKSCVVGYISSSYANARGVSTAKQTKIVDAIAGQGVVLQPYTKLGVATWYVKGNVLLTSESYDPITTIKGYFSNPTDVVWKLKAGGSRLYPIQTGFTFTSTTAFTWTGKAEDDWGTDHLKYCYFFVADDPVDNVYDFIKGVGTATYKGTFTSGSAATTTIASNKYCNVLALADDGSIAIFSKKNA